MKSPLKWAGGKSKLVNIIKPIYDKYRTRVWVDLFGGSCALPMLLQPKSVIINDINTDLIDFWKWVKFDGLVTEFEFKNEETYYYEMRDKFNKYRTPELFYYLNKTCYNGLCRYNKNNIFNVPFGKHKKIEYEYNFAEYAESIYSWNFLNLNYKNFPIKETDFVYADPPYDGGFTNYCGKFTWNDQVDLANRLAESGAVVVASNKATDRILKLYKGLGFKVEIIKVGRSISCNGDRKPVDEMLATKNIT